MSTVSFSIPLRTSTSNSTSFFRFALRIEKLFNHTGFVDVTHIARKPVLHVLDEAAPYQRGIRLSEMIAEATWRALKLCWIDVYIGRTDLIAHDAGKHFIAENFQI